MAHYIISYLGGNQPATPEQGKQHFEKYKAWLSSIETVVVSPANPFKHTHTVHPNGSVTPSSTTTMSGYTLVDVDSIETALELAKTCPFLDIGGSLEVSQIMTMPS